MYDAITVGDGLPILGRGVICPACLVRSLYLCTGRQGSPSNSTKGSTMGISLKNVMGCKHSAPVKPTASVKPVVDIEPTASVASAVDVEPPVDIEQLYDRIKHLLPKQRGNVKVDNLTFFRALHHKAKSKCVWRKLPKEFGNWSTIQQRFFRWRDTGVFGEVENALRGQGYSNFFWTKIRQK